MGIGIRVANNLVPKKDTLHSLPSIRSLDSSVLFQQAIDLCALLYLPTQNTNRQVALMGGASSHPICSWIPSVEEGT